MKQHPISPKKTARNPNSAEKPNVRGHLVFQLFRGISLFLPPMLKRIVDPLHGSDDITGPDHGENTYEKNTQGPNETDFVEGVI